MKKYVVELSELIHYKTFDVVASDLDQARDLARGKIEDGEVQIRTIETANCNIRGTRDEEEQIRM